MLVSLFTQAGVPNAVPVLLPEGKPSLSLGSDFLSVLLNLSFVIFVTFILPSHYSFPLQHEVRSRGGDSGGSALSVRSVGLWRAEWYMAVVDGYGRTSLWGHSGGWSW